VSSENSDSDKFASIFELMIIQSFIHIHSCPRLSTIYFMHSCYKTVTTVGTKIQMKIKKVREKTSWLLDSDEGQRRVDTRILMKVKEGRLCQSLENTRHRNKYLFANNLSLLWNTFRLWCRSRHIKKHRWTRNGAADRIHLYTLLLCPCIGMDLPYLLEKKKKIDNASAVFIERKEKKRKREKNASAVFIEQKEENNIYDWLNSLLLVIEQVLIIYINI
jgi:hypothetical protein